MVIARSIPLRDLEGHVGALVLFRDVTDLRSRDRELVTKDATIREIHHRVKNNLQTVAALLRLQARRMQVPEARAALEEAVRRVGSIALVHETLSQSLDEHVDFDEIADRLRTTVADVSSGVASSSGVITSSRTGSFGTVPGEVATALAMVLTELVQNAAEHAFPDGPRPRRRSPPTRRRPGGWSPSATTASGCRPTSTWSGPRAWGCRSCARSWSPSSGGSIEIGAGPGRGTTVRLVVPTR